MQRSTRSSSSAEEVAGSIDTLSEILLRLAAKPLLRFKCVSKQWLSLISDPRFCHTHTLHHHHHHHNPSPCSLLLSDNCGPSPHFKIIPLTTTSDTNPSMVRALNLDFLNHPRVAIVRSCNGLLLCHSGSTYLVCNPTTKKFVTLSFPNQQFRNQTHALYLAFDPLRSPHYQVISIRILGSHKIQGVSMCEFNVYSSATSLWSDPGVCYTAPSKVITGAGVYCNHAIHWCNDDGESSLYFDIDSQCLKNLPRPLPNEEWGNRSVEYFGESCGFLHLILRKKTLKFDILELKDDYSVWSLRHHVDLNPIRVEFPELHGNLANFVLPFYIVCQAKEENSMLVLLVGGTAISYTPVNCISRKLCDFKPDMTMVDAVAGYVSGEVFQYFESLSFVGAFTAYY